MKLSHHRNRMVERTQRFGVAASLLLASSCALPSWGPSASTKPSSGMEHALYQVTDQKNSNTQSGQSPESEAGPGTIQQLSHETTAGAEESIREWPALPNGQFHPFAPPAVPAQYSVPACPTPDCYPAEPRIALPSEALSLQNCPMPWEQGREVPVPVCEPEVWADEYLCDGGDRGLPIHYHGLERAGLETEDTIGEFTDHHGDSRVTPSSRACIYAPQFASVRSISSPQTDLTVDRAAGTHDRLPPVGMTNRRAAQEGLQNDQPIGLIVRSKVSGLDLDTATDSLEQIAAAVNHIKLINLFEDRAFFQRVELNQTEEAYLAYGLQSAVAWTRDLNPAIVATDVGGQEVIARFKVEDYTGVEDKRTPGDLKIIKLADKHSAHPGDLVTFTIHFDNVGQRELTSVRIIDNLTPRLELIESSVNSDRKGRMSVEDNGEGSLILSFELEGPLEGESGGTVTFQARVR